MNDKRYDPKLREAISKIEDILEKYDIGGAIVLCSETHSEFKLALDTPSWSNIRLIKGGKGFHVKLYMKSDKKRTEASVGMLYSIRDMSGSFFMQCDQISKQIEQNVIVEHKPFHGLNNDDM